MPTMRCSRPPAGWPMLAAAHLHGRADAIRELLPAFLEREVLPVLPQPLAAAAFAALTAPLSAAALSSLCDGAAMAHPLLRLENAEWRLSGTWVRDALLVLRRSSAALTPAVRERLRSFYSRLKAPDDNIVELAGIGELGEALEVFKNAGGVFFGCRHGYRALETALGVFPAEWELRVEELYLARLWLLIKSGKPREALLKLEARHPGLPVDLRRLRLTHRAEALLLRSISRWISTRCRRSRSSRAGNDCSPLLPARDDIARGLLYNSMAIGFLQADSLAEAKRLAEESLAAYEAAGSPYLAHCMHLHFMRRGSAAEPAQRRLAAAAAGGACARSVGPHVQFGARHPVRLQVADCGSRKGGSRKIPGSSSPYCVRCRRETAGRISSCVCPCTSF